MSTRHIVDLLKCGPNHVAVQQLFNERRHARSAIEQRHLTAGVACVGLPTAQLVEMVTLF